MSCNHHPARCRCFFLPPFVVDAVVKNTTGEDKQAAIATATKSLQMRDARSVPLPVEKVIAANAPKPPKPTGGRRGLAPGEASVAAASRAPRTVYDCKNQWTQRVGVVRKEAGKAVVDRDVNITYDLAGKVREYWQTELGWDSIDNAGLGLELNVHYGAKYMNAFWDGDEMTFGDGDGKIFSGFCQSLDVIGHELAHGVVQHTANLAYANQSGALNEHFADVFGTVVSQMAEGQTAETADWLIGDEIMGPTLYGEALRSMRAPGTAYDNSLIGKDPQPSHMSKLYTGTGDNGGVHINSGIMNRVFFLVATALNDTPAAGRLWFQTLQSLGPTADFAAAASALAEAARLLTRDGALPKGTPQIVRGALRDVGI